MQLKGGEEQLAWTLWERWIAEIVADFWALAKVGIAATTGLSGVVSLPRAFVFRIAMDDPHEIGVVGVVASVCHVVTLLMAKLFTYSSGLAGSNSRPITLNFL